MPRLGLRGRINWALLATPSGLFIFWRSGPKTDLMKTWRGRVNFTLCRNRLDACFWTPVSARTRIERMSNNFLGPLVDLTVQDSILLKKWRNFTLRWNFIDSFMSRDFND